MIKSGNNGVSILDKHGVGEQIIAGNWVFTSDKANQITITNMDGQQVIVFLFNQV